MSGRALTVRGPVGWTLSGAVVQRGLSFTGAPTTLEVRARDEEGRPAEVQTTAVSSLDMAVSTCGRQWVLALSRPVSAARLTVWGTATRPVRVGLRYKRTVWPPGGPVDQQHDEGLVYSRRCTYRMVHPRFPGYKLEMRTRAGKLLWVWEGGGSFAGFTWDEAGCWICARVPHHHDLTNLELRRSSDGSLLFRRELPPACRGVQVRGDVLLTLTGELRTPRVLHLWHLPNGAAGLMCPPRAVDSPVVALSLAADAAYFTAGGVLMRQTRRPLHTFGPPVELFPLGPCPAYLCPTPSRELAWTDFECEEEEQVRLHVATLAGMVRVVPVAGTLLSVGTPDGCRVTLACTSGRRVLAYE